MSKWIRRIEDTLANQLPHFGSPPPFPWKEFEASLKEAFQLDLSLFLEKSGWETNAISEQFGENPHILPLSAFPLTGDLYWVMAAEDLSHFISWTLDKKGSFDLHMEKSYYHFMMLQALVSLQEVKAYPDLSFKISGALHPLHGGVYCMDIGIQYEGETLYGRLILSSEFSDAFKHHFKERTTPLKNYPLSQEILLNLSFEIGRVTLDALEWETVKQGDFLLLDRFSYHLKEHKGTASLLLNGNTVLKGKIKDNRFKVSEFMTDDYEEEETEEETEEEEMTQEEDYEEEEASEQSEKMLEAKDVPLLLKLEMGSLKMSLHDLLDLTAGSVVDLPFTPLEGLKLTLNGRLIARGELVEIGDAAGVRITEIVRG